MVCFAAGNYSQEGGGDGGEPALPLHLLLSELQVTLPSTPLGPRCAHPEHTTCVDLSFNHPEANKHLQSFSLPPSPGNQISHGGDT